MIRRHRPQRETAFSFDSFLDLVTNVVGIIIRLILVVWVGARSYSGFTDLVKDKQTAAVTVPALPADPLEQELARQHAELAEAQKRLLDQLRQLDLTKDSDTKAAAELASLDADRQDLDRVRSELDRNAAAQGKTGQEFVLTMADLQARREKISEEIKALEKLPPLSKVLRYRTPVSRPVHSEEWHFECYQGRVAFVDVSTMLEDVRSRLHDKGEELKTQWHASDVTETIGAFRMHYVLERQRDGVESAFSLAPAGRASFGYGLSEWVIEPMAPVRGETLQAALAARSEFRHVADGLSPALATVTFWVYPDSFAVYRQLRDYLADRDIAVAGRPLPEGTPITCSRHGSVSLGQ